ncbi:MAG: hypothetical protein LBU17_02780 [Treponema sp.]|jgi:hypothetical protein|nr:hypothetical protein [Treponema sp.]
MAKDRNLRDEIKELGIFSIEGSGLLTEKSVFSALDAIKESNSRRSEESEWEHIKELQAQKTQRMQGTLSD